MNNMEKWVKPFIVIVFLLVMCIALWAMTLYYLHGFKKGKKENKYKAYYFNSKLLLISFVLLTLNAICAITGVAMILLREKSFGIELLWTFAGLSAAFFLAEAIFSCFTYNYIFIGLEDEKIQFWGEKVLCRKIIEIVKLEEENKLYIFFKYGERNLRKEKLALNTVAASFLIENLHALNFKVADQISKETKELMNKKTDSEATSKIAEKKDKPAVSKEDSKPVQENKTEAKLSSTAKDDSKNVETDKKETKPKAKKVEKLTESEINDEKQEENKKLDKKGGKKYGA